MLLFYFIQSIYRLISKYFIFNYFIYNKLHVPPILVKLLYIVYIFSPGTVWPCLFFIMLFLGAFAFLWYQPNWSFNEERKKFWTNTPCKHIIIILLKPGGHWDAVAAQPFIFASDGLSTHFCISKMCDQLVPIIDQSFGVRKI